MKNFQKGSVFIISLIFIFLTALFAAGILLITSIEHRNVIRDQWSLTALHLAEAGAEDAIWTLKNSDWGGGWDIMYEHSTTNIKIYAKPNDLLIDESVWSAWAEAPEYAVAILNPDDSTEIIGYYDSREATPLEGSTNTEIGDYSVIIINPISSYSYHIATVEATGYSPDINAADKIERTLKVSVGVYSGENTGNIKSALSTNCKTKITGGLIVDGRDHDKDDPDILTEPADDIPCIANKGVWGIYTTVSDTNLDTTGSYDIGGTDFDDLDPKDDYPPDKPYDPNVVCLNASTYPSTPDAVLDFEPGSLKKIAQAGVNGSRYTTDPTTLTGTLTGVTYVENDWNVGGTFTLNGTGILVVHNSSTNSELKNLNQGTFKGIIICDNVETFKNNVIGVVIALSTTPSSVPGIVGTGDGRILYSEESVENAFDDAGGESGATVLTWQEQ